MIANGTEIESTACTCSVETATKSRTRPDRTGWRDSPKVVAEYFREECGSLAQDWDALPSVVDRMKRKHRRAIRSDVSNMLGDMLRAFEECGAVSKEQGKRLYLELNAALDCIVEGTIGERIKAAIVTRAEEGECFTYDGFESVEAARSYLESDELPSYYAKERTRLVVYGDPTEAMTTTEATDAMEEPATV